MLKGLRSSIRIVLGAFLVALLLGQSSPAGASGIPASAAKPASASHSAPALESTWYITWKTSSHYVFHTTASDGGYADEDYTLAQSGSTLVNEYEDGTWNNTDFVWHVTDNYHWDFQDIDNFCPGGPGWDTEEVDWSVTDPDRYSGAVNHTLNVAAEQLPGGTWQVSVPFAPFMDPNDAGNTYPYTEVETGEDTSCGSPIPISNTYQIKLPFKTCFLPFPAILAGDDQGKDFTYDNTFSGTYGNGPTFPTDGVCGPAYWSTETATLSIDIGVHRMTGGILVNDEGGQPVADAQVFRNGSLAGKTDSGGILIISDLAAGDKLVARKQIVENPSVKNVHNQDSTQNWSSRVYITSLDIPQASEPTPFKVTNSSALQTLTLKKSNTLVGFNIVASVEWDANASYLSDLQQGFQSASNYLYDASNGQMQFERVTIYDNNQNMDNADYQLRASNQERPRADVSGIHNNNLWHVYLGRDSFSHSWSDVWGYRTQIHEFGHYGLGLYDSYYYYDAGGNKIDSFCTSQAIKTNLTPDVNATIMDYQFNASEFSMLNVAGAWSAQCILTDQWKKTMDSDWQGIVFKYQDSDFPVRWQLKTPADYGGVVPGPHIQPVSGWSSVTIGNDANTGVCEPPPTYVIKDSAGKLVEGAEVTLDKGVKTIYEGKTPIKGSDNIPGNGKITVLGASNGDLVAASIGGASPAVNLYVVACGAGGPVRAASIQPTDIILQPAPFTLDISTAPGAAAGQMEVTVKASTSLSAAPETSLTQNGADSAVGVSLSYDAVLQAYTGTVTLDGSLPAMGNLLVKATDTSSQTVEIGTQFALDPVAVDQDVTVWSADGQVELYLPSGSLSASGRLSIVPGEVAGSLPSDLVMLSGPYTLQADAGMSLVNPANLSLNYLDPSGGYGSAWVSSAQLYRWDGHTWQALASTFSNNEQMVSVPITAFGTYALMGTLSYPVYLPMVIR